MNKQIIRSLRALLTPPSSPKGCGSVAAWSEFEAASGVVLPNDYKEFIGIYGACTIGGEITVFSPHIGSLDGSLISSWEHYLARWKETRDARIHAMPLFPEPAGILPWGYTGSADALCWITGGDPDQWGTIVVDVSLTEYRGYSLGFAEFLYKLLIKKRPTRFFPVVYNENLVVKSVEVF